MMVTEYPEYKRQIWQCLNAKVTKKGRGIICSKGHQLNKGHKTIHISEAEMGKPMELTVCQTCESYIEMGAPLLDYERGWENLP